MRVLADDLRRCPSDDKGRADSIGGSPVAGMETELRVVTAGRIADASWGAAVCPNAAMICLVAAGPDPRVEGPGLPPLRRYGEIAVA